jgi:hypothetical protein
MPSRVVVLILSREWLITHQYFLYEPIFLDRTRWQERQEAERGNGSRVVDMERAAF